MSDQPSPTRKTRRPEGVEIRHTDPCRSHQGGACNCQPAFRAYVYDRATKQKVRRAFGTLAEAKAWRASVTVKRDKGRRIAPSKVTLRQAAEAWLAGAEAGTLRNRSGEPYKPSALRGYRYDLEKTVLPELGAHPLSAIRRSDFQRLVDRLVGDGLSRSKISNVVTAAQVVYRDAIQRDDDLELNPAVGLRLPAGGQPRQRAASVTEVAELIAVLLLEDRALWATAAYAGLRRGELRGLRWENVDLANGIIHVRHAWDDVEGEILPKSKAGLRTVPIVPLLRDHLTELKTRTGREGRDFVFGPKADQPFTSSQISKRAAIAWKAANEDRAERELPPLVPIGLHECRHSYVSLMHAAGFTLEQIAPYAGHSASSMTEQYKHLITGHEQDTADRFAAYLELADTRARLVQLEGLEDAS
jgi:integrase